MLQKIILNILLFITVITLICGNTYIMAQNCLESEPALEDSWDWRQNEKLDAPNELWYKSYVKLENDVNILKYIRSPFKAGGVNSTNVAFYSDPIIKDYHPEDGWVLVKRSFGKSNPNDSQDYTNYETLPYFILYNKYRGLFRIFVYSLKSYEDVSKINLVLGFKATSIFNAATFSHRDQFLRTLDNFKQDANAPGIMLHSSPNAAFTDAVNGFWLSGDFAMMYDPCVCLMNANEAVLNFTVQKVTNSTVQLTINGQLKPELYSNEESKQNITGTEVVKALYEGYKAGTEFQDLIFGGKEQQNEAKTKEGIESGLASFLSGVSESSIGPFGGALFGLVDLLISGGETESKTPKPTVYNVDLTANGTISQLSNQAEASFYLPGTRLIPGIEDVKKPSYNKPLGIFNLIKTPTLEYIDYKSNQNLYGEVLNPAIIRQYKVKDPLEYVINPSLDVDIIDIQTSVIVRYTTNEVTNLTFYPFSATRDLPITFLDSYDLSDYPPDLTQRLATGGFEIDFYDKDYTFGNQLPPGPEIRLRTPYVPINCFQSQSFVLSRAGDTKYLPYFYTKVILKLKRKNAPTAEPLYYVYTYEMPDVLSSQNVPSNQIYHWDWSTDRNNIGNGLPGYHIQYLQSNLGPGPLWSLPYYQVPYDLVIDYPVNQSEAKYAINSITIKQGASFGPNCLSVDYRAGNYVQVDPDVVIQNPNPNLNAILAIENSSPMFRGCSSTLLAPKDKDYIDAFCKDRNRYKPKSNGQFSSRISNFTNVNTLAPNFSLYPNPARNEVNLSVQGMENGSITIEIQDLVSRTIQDPISIEVKNGVPNQPINVSGLSAGVYLVKITHSTGSSTTKLVIQKEN